MNSVALAARQVWYINKAFVRNPATLFFTLIFPLMFLVIFTVIFGNGHILVGPGKLVRVATFYVPAISAFSVINACYTNIAIGLATCRRGRVQRAGCRGHSCHSERRCRAGGRERHDPAFALHLQRLHSARKPHRLD